MTSKKDEIVELITRLLLYRELSGYNIYRQILSKGVGVRPNYLYMILAEMRSKGILSSRRSEGQKGRPRLLFSLSEKGREEFRKMTRNSLAVLMDAFTLANVKSREGPDHAFVLRKGFELSGLPLPGKGDKFVMAAPSFDPISCQPLAFRIASEMFPSVSLVVVKPPGLRFYDDRPNVSFVDGHRHDMPLKDGFADYLLLDGFPREATEKNTIVECARVLKGGGQFILRFSAVMTQEVRPRFTNFGEFLTKQYYDVFEPDRKVSRERVRELLSGYFENLREAEVRGNIVINATRRRVVTPASEVISQVGR